MFRRGKGPELPSVVQMCPVRKGPINNSLRLRYLQTRRVSFQVTCL